MPLSLYQTVKSAITVRQVGEMYGMEPTVMAWYAVRSILTATPV